MTALEEQPVAPTIPYSITAEEAVMGAILINPDAYYEIAHILRAEDFYIHRLKWIFEACAHLQEKHIPLDLITVTEVLDRKEQLTEVGGPAYLTSLISQTPSSLNAEAYAEIIASHAARRRMIQAANRIAMLAYDEKQGIETATSQAIQALESAVVQSTGNTLQPLSTSLKQVYEFVDESSRKAELLGVPSGIHDLDVLLGNFQKGDVYIFAARPGQGKTSLLQSILMNAAKVGKRCALFSLEMSNEKVTDRWLAQETNLNVQMFITGKIDEHHWTAFTAGIERLEQLPIFTDDTPAISPAQVLARCRKLIMTSGPLDLVAIDYLQLMKPNGKSENRTQEIGLISRALKSLAKELNVPVLAAAQLNRALEARSDKRPQLSDLRESGDIEQDADVVAFIHRPDMENEQVELIIAKHRNGPVGSVLTRFNKTLTRFEALNSKK
jgi:replicative DNA helicase